MAGHGALSPHDGRHTKHEGPGAVKGLGAGPSGTQAAAHELGQGLAGDAVAAPVEVGVLQVIEVPAAVGTRAKPLKTPVATSPAGRKKICTREPACPLHAISLDKALAAGKPTVLNFGTPLLCSSQMCGPVVDEQMVAADKLGARASFIHVEIYPSRDTAKPVKALTEGLRKTGGRNNHGRVTAWHRGGGHKRRYRLIDFKRRKFGVAAAVERLEYDPNRSAFIALIKYDDGELAYILAPQRLQPGDRVIADERVDVKPGNAAPLRSVPVGTILHNVELKPGKGGQLARSAGTYVQLVGRDGDYAQLRLSSGEIRRVRAECIGSIGAVSNPDHQNINYGKAGRMRWLGRRPTVRGVAMNPVDHPHGGGEGRTSGGRHPVTPWGKPTKGARTRSKRKSNRLIVRSRHLAKKRRG